MSNRNSFYQNYPATVQEALYTPCIARMGWLALITTLPPPSVKGVKPYLRSCGFADNAIRTAFSRERKRDNFRFFDDKGTERYDMKDFGQSMTRFYLSEKKEERGLTLAVFQFSTGQNQSRYRMKELLRIFGFQMLTQNAYVTERIDHSELLHLTKEAGLTEHLFLLDTDYPSGTTLEKVRGMFRLDDWTKKLNNFKTDMMDFLKDAELSDDSCYDRSLYLAMSFHNHIRTGFPPLSKEIFPARILLKKIDGAITEYYMRHGQTHLKVYGRRHGGSI